MISKMIYNNKKIKLKIFKALSLMPKNIIQISFSNSKNYKIKIKGKLNKEI